MLIFIFDLVYLDQSERREIPLPNCHALRCLQADDTIKDFMNRDFPKKTDDRYKRMQSAVNASVAPALNLWRDLDEQGFTAGQSGLVPVDTVLDVLQRTVVLVGNASNYISQCRRDNVIAKMEFRNKGLASVMKSVCKQHKPEGDLLFGSAVHKALSLRELKQFQPSKRLLLRFRIQQNLLTRLLDPMIKSFFEGARLPIAAEGRARYTDRKIA